MDRSKINPKRKAELLGFRPLYRQVRDLLVKRIVDNVWKPGERLPNEFEVADELGVSQGTVRKALNTLEAEKFIIRRQGKGTYVASHDEARILFQFFKLVPDSGNSKFPDSRILSVKVETANTRIASTLALRPGTRVVRIERVRFLGGRCCIFENIRLPRVLFPGIEKRDLPNNLYELYRSDFGITIVRASERLKAIAAKKHEAKFLNVKPGAPLLLVDRTAYADGDHPVEWRTSLCHTDTLHYAVDLR